MCIIRSYSQMIAHALTYLKTLRLSRNTLIGTARPLLINFAAIMPYREIVDNFGPLPYCSLLFQRSLTFS